MYLFSGRYEPNYYKLWDTEKCRAKFVGSREIVQIDSDDEIKNCFIMGDLQKRVTSVAYYNEGIERQILDLGFCHIYLYGGSLKLYYRDRYYNIPHYNLCILFEIFDTKYFYKLYFGLYTLMLPKTGKCEALYGYEGGKSIGENISFNGFQRVCCM